MTGLSAVPTEITAHPVVVVAIMLVMILPSFCYHRMSLVPATAFESI
jgi:hypothetical protein